jgi:hypothetical protein
MSFRKTLGALSLLVAIMPVMPTAILAQGQYLDVSIVKVKPEKTAEFEALARKVADANRRGDGDRWLALQAVYGETNTYLFTSRRNDFADITKGNNAFTSAMHKAFGKEAAEKTLNEVNNCVISWRNELRTRRPDLSSKAPTDPRAFNKMVGGSRVLRTIAIHVRPGHASEFEAMVKDINAHAEHNPDAQAVLVSQVIEGGRGNTYYITFFRSSLAGFDKNPTLKDILGEEGMVKLEKTVSETEAASESAIYRFSPELSNPPQEIAEVATDFWNPKPLAASAMQRPKVKPATETKPVTATSKEPQR